jgi:hypothetical protein
VIATIDDADNIFVGGQFHKIDLKIVDAAGLPIKGFHTTAAVSVPELTGKLNTNMVDIRDGVVTAPLVFTPYFVSQYSAKLSIQVLGVDEISGNVFTVHPEKPARLGFYDVAQKIEAKEGNLVQAKIAIFDRYGNIASYKTEAYTTTLTIPGEYTSMISLTGKASTKNYLFVEGTAIANVYSTDIPG